MKKSICILACALTLALTGCQKQIEQFDTETNSSTTTSNSSTDLGSISENDTVNSKTNSDQVDRNDDTIYDDDLSNTDTSSNQTNSKDNSEADTPYDDGYSGTDFDRPGVTRLLEDAKTGKINLIICKDLSRFGRNYIQVGQYIDYIFPTYNIRFIALYDHIDTADKDNSAMDMMPIVNLFNEWHYSCLKTP